MLIIVAATDEEAQAKRESYLQYADQEGALALFGGWTGVDLSGYSDDEDFRFTESPRLSLGGLGAKAVGSPTTVADELESWIEISGVDGFNLAHVTNPGSFEDIIEFLLPELRKRGVFRNDVEKEGATAREVFIGSKRLPEDHPGSQYKWRAGEALPEYRQREDGKTASD